MNWSAPRKPRPLESGRAPLAGSARSDSSGPTDALSPLGVDGAGSLVYCRDCQAANHPGATVCEGCATRLTPGNTTAPARALTHEDSVQGQKEPTVMEQQDGCSCGHRGICLTCVIGEYEGDPLAMKMMATALDTTEKALARFPARMRQVQGGGARTQAVREQALADRRLK